MADRLCRTLPRQRRRSHASKQKRMRLQTVLQTLPASPPKRTRPSTEKPPRKPSLSRRRTEQQMLPKSSRKPPSRTRRRLLRLRCDAMKGGKELSPSWVGPSILIFALSRVGPLDFISSLRGYCSRSCSGVSAWHCPFHGVYATIMLS
jgi:hypothetical protein